MPAPDASRSLLRLSVRSADAKVELAAASLLEQIRLALKLAQLPLPIPIDDWIELPLGYHFGIATADELGPGVLGLARPTTGEILIHQDLLQHEGRYRFTCAHELAHVVLHGDHAGDLLDQELPAAPNAAVIERQADRFASAILMPLADLPRAISDAVRGHGLSDTTIDLARGDGVESIWLWRACLIPVLCARYGVSRPAMIYRCRELRLPRGRRLLRPSLVPLLLAPESAVIELRLDDIRVVDGAPVSK